MRVRVGKCLTRMAGGQCSPEGEALTTTAAMGNWSITDRGIDQLTTYHFVLDGLLVLCSCGRALAVVNRGLCGTDQDQKPTPLHLSPTVDPSDFIFLIIP